MDQEPTMSINRRISKAPECAIVATFLILWLTACGTAQPDDMRSQTQVSATVCSSKSVAEATNNLVQAWSRCYIRPETTYVRGVGVITTASSNSIRVQNIDGGNAVMVIYTMPVTDRSFIRLLADIRKTEACNAEVIVRSGAGGWSAGARYTSIWLENPGEGGPALYCH